MSVVEYTEFLVKNLVNDPDMVRVEEFLEDDTKIILVMIPEDEMKYVIGKSGKNAKALRTLIYAYAYVHKLDKLKINFEAF